MTPAVGTEAAAEKQDSGTERPPIETASQLNCLAMMCALLRDALDREGTEFRVLVADLADFLEPC
jgi:hypothetical protein